MNQEPLAPLDEDSSADDTPRNSATITVRRDPATGRFARGNPGKPKGARNKATLIAQSLLQSDANALVQRVKELAMSGSVTAMKLCLDRLVPLRRERAVEFDLPHIETANDAVLAAGWVTAMVASVEMTPSEGQAISSIIETLRRAIETAELERRILLLEGRPT